MKERLAAKGYRNPVLEDGLVEASVCVSLQPSLGSSEERKLWSVDIRRAVPGEDNFKRDVCA